VIVVLERGATEAQVGQAVVMLEGRGLGVRVVHADGRPLIHVVSGDSRRARRALALEGVEALVPTSGPRVRKTGRRFWPFHFIRWSAVALVLISFLVLLAGQFPAGLGAPISAHQPPSEVSQPWYLRAPLRFVELFPAGLAWVAGLVLLALALLAFFLPHLDRSRSAALSDRLPAVGIGLLLVVLWIAASFGGGLG
jgi:quinol-cytochrome oxidoreductase complex cytochrome b subunit